MSRFINPVPEYRPNSRLFFFKAGTNTQLVTYKDELESIPNAHPVLCDSAGNTPNVFYQGSAKLIVLDENDVQYIECDPIGGDTELGNFTLWETTVTYDLNDIVEGSDGKFYISLSNGNTANDPTTTPTEWAEIRFIGVWNTNVLYSIGDVVQTSNGNLWKALTATAGNDPSTDDGTNWLPAIDGAKVPEIVSLEAADTANITTLIFTGGGVMVIGRVNELQDGDLTYTLPAASSVNTDEFMIVTQALEFVSFEPVVTADGSDLITIKSGSDTSITFDQTSSKDIRLTSNGVDEWRLTV